MPNKNLVEQQSIPPPLLTQKLNKVEEDAYFKKFFGTFKELHINLALLDVLLIIPKCSKYIKDVVIKKMRLGDIEMVSLIDGSSYND